MKSMIALAAVAGLATVASAEVITSYTTFGQPGNQVFTAPNVQADNVTGMNLTRGPGLTATGANNSFSASGWSTDQSQDYFSFGFTVADGYAVNLESLFIGTRSSNTGPGLLGLFVSTDGFSSNLFTFVQLPDNTFSNSAIDLSALQGLTGEVEFRIAVLENTSANGGTIASSGTFRVGDYFDGSYSEMRFEGTVVPTPGAIAMLGLGGLVATRRRR